MTGSKLYSSSLSEPLDEFETCGFNHLTRYFELTIDLCADPLARLAFIDHLSTNSWVKKVAVNGPLADLNEFFSAAFIWHFTDIQEVKCPFPLNVDDWLLLSVDEVFPS